MIENLPSGKKIIFFSPHPDDDAFSSGAFLYSLSKKKNKILTFYLTLSPRGVPFSHLSEKEKREIRKKEAKESSKILGTKPIFLELDKPSFEISEKNIKIIAQILKKEKPDFIFLPSKEEIHPTHKKCFYLIKKAIEKVKLKGFQEWRFEVWSPIPRPNFIFFFDRKLMKIKKEAIKKHSSQIKRINLEKAAEGLNLFRGIMGKEIMKGFAGFYPNQKKYGEAFFIKRHI